MPIDLPKLRKITVNSDKKKIFLLTDDIMSASGVGTMAKELVYGTCDAFDWVQLAAAIQHQYHGQVIDLSEQIEKETGKNDVYVKLYGHNGYFSPDAFYQVMEIEKPDAVMIFTDPRHYMQFWPHEHTIRSKYKIPIIYYSVWDSEIVPKWNTPFYNSCDLLLAINKQTHEIHKKLTDFIEVDDVTDKTNKTLVKYLPHGINKDIFYPCKDDADFKNFEKIFKEKHKIKNVIFWNSRNIRRKQPGDIILAFKMFCDEIENPEDYALVMKTDPYDPNGTDLYAVRDAICPNYKVIFITAYLTQKQLNFYYNMSDVTVSLSSAEGFGLSTAESLMAGTPIIAPVHGGLQDQMGFKQEKFKSLSAETLLPSTEGYWAFPLPIRARLLQGSIPTPYLFDYVSDARDLANALHKTDFLESGRDWMIENMSADKMCNDFVTSVNKLLQYWMPKPKYELIKIENINKVTETV